MNRGPRGSKNGWFRGEATGGIVSTLRYKRRRSRAGGVRTRSCESCRKNILRFMVDQRIHIVITYGTRGRHVEAPRLFYMHPIIIWSVCVLFYLPIEQSRQVIISQSFSSCYWLPHQHVIIFTPTNSAQWINARVIGRIPMHLKGILEYPSSCRRHQR